MQEEKKAWDFPGGAVVKNPPAFMHVVTNGKISFFFYGWIIFCVCVYTTFSLSIRQLMDT